MVIQCVKIYHSRTHTVDTNATHSIWPLWLVVLLHYTYYIIKHRYSQMAIFNFVYLILKLNQFHSKVLWELFTNAAYTAIDKWQIMTQLWGKGIVRVNRCLSLVPTIWAKTVCLTFGYIVLREWCQNLTHSHNLYRGN